MSRHRQPPVIIRGRDPFELALVGICATWAALGLLLPAPGPSANLAAALGGWAPVFYVMLGLSALAVLTGALWPRSTVGRLEDSLVIEFAGLLPLAGCLLAYALIIRTNGSTALGATIFTAGIGVAGLVRAAIVLIDLHRLRHAIHAEGDRRAEEARTEEVT